MRMKIFLITLVLTLGLGTTLVAQNQKVPLKNDKETVLFDVSMTCENCQKRIEKNIAFEKGVTDMKVDLANKTVLVEFKKTQTSVDKLQAAIAKLGYDVKIHKDGKE